MYTHLFTNHDGKQHGQDSGIMFGFIINSDLVAANLKSYIHVCRYCQIISVFLQHRESICGCQIENIKVKNWAENVLY